MRTTKVGVSFAAGRLRAWSNQSLLSRVHGGLWYRGGHGPGGRWRHERQMALLGKQHLHSVHGHLHLFIFIFTYAYLHLYMYVHIYFSMYILYYILKIKYKRREKPFLVRSFLLCRGRKCFFPPFVYKHWTAFWWCLQLHSLVGFVIWLVAEWDLSRLYVGGSAKGMTSVGKAYCYRFYCSTHIMKD